MAKRSTSIFLAFLNLAAFAATLVVNALSTLLPINGKDPGEISDQYPNLFVPSGLTFSVWGVIYILLGLFVIYGLVSAFKKTPDQDGLIGRIGILFFLSSLFNIGWIFFWHYGFVGISLLMMAALFLTLLSIYLRLGIGRSQARAAERGMVHIAFSVYLGWITIAHWLEPVRAQRAVLGSTGDSCGNSNNIRSSFFQERYILRPGSRLGHTGNTFKKAGRYIN